MQHTQHRDQISFNILRQVEIQLKCHCITSLASKQIQTECLFDVPQPFFPQNQKHNWKNFLSIYFRSFWILKHYSIHSPCWARYVCTFFPFLRSMKRANYSSLLILHTQNVVVHCADLYTLSSSFAVWHQQPFFWLMLLIYYVNHSNTLTEKSVGDIWGVCKWWVWN